MFLFNSKLREVNVLAELSNNTDNRTVLYKHRTGRNVVQIK